MPSLIYRLNPASLRPEIVILKHPYATVSLAKDIVVAADVVERVITSSVKRLDGKIEAGDRTMPYLTPKARTIAYRTQSAMTIALNTETIKNSAPLRQHTKRSTAAAVDRRGQES